MNHSSLNASGKLPPKKSCQLQYKADLEKGNLGLRCSRGSSSLSPKASLGREGWEQGETCVSGREHPAACSVLGEEKARTAWQRCWAGVSWLSVSTLLQAPGLGLFSIKQCCFPAFGSCPHQDTEATPVPPALQGQSYIPVSSLPICRHFTPFVLEPAMSFSLSSSSPMVGADISLMPHIFTFLTRRTGDSDQPQVLQKTGEPRAGKHE